HLLQEQRLPNEIHGVLLSEDRFRQAGERREFVDHPPQVPDLTNDRAGQLLEQLPVLIDLLTVASLEPLGSKLDRRERVLDRVGDAPGNVRPCRLTLIEQLPGDVLESDDMTFRAWGDLDG